MLIALGLKTIYFFLPFLKKFIYFFFYIYKHFGDLTAASTNVTTMAPRRPKGQHEQPEGLFEK